ncbi:IgGFc-binding protein [Chondromyces apiculatus]|uniref:IgGFc-binding protein N-terminal domain-containing protein n=1 Tax=Chondromyces apiculatus DSM 436 TaxID=1192034 RepID=A0A017TGV7_9BACT|nr:IgGFc-binding protein [Chondromyces apiculatus]EYF08152.1 Hypothetical protein CAP_5912 [Chondromyces apiculatus DSM 436]
MKWLHKAMIAVSGLGFSAVLAMSCSATSEDGGFEPSGGNPGSGGSGGSGGSSGVLTGGPGSGGNSGCTTQTCSSDLHQILDCDGNLIEECPPTQGCGETGCVEACESARQNKSSIGCDYYAVAPDMIFEAVGACFAAFVANTWTTPVSIAVERDGQSFDLSQFARIPSGNGQGLTYAPLPNGQLPPGEVAILFLARYGNVLTNCPNGVTPAFTANYASVSGTGMGAAFHLTTSAPVVAYTIFPYGGGASAATSASLLLPTTVWDTNYIAVDAFRKSTLVAQAQPSIDIVAAENDTVVTINPVAPIVGGPGVASAPAGAPATYTLQRGQVLQFSQDQQLIGSPIESNKPIGLWGAASCLSIDVGVAACDSAHQQIPPVKALGNEYVAVRYRNRFDDQEESPPWRIVGAVDGTTLTYEPAAPAGAPTTLNSGQVAEFSSPGPFVVRSQDEGHPFYVSAHMTGCRTLTNGSDCRGDPEFVNVIPSGQYLKSYTFFTDPTYPETNLVITRRRTATGFADVQLACAGTLTGWQPVGTSGEYEYTRFDLVRGNFVPQGGCDNGRNEISSAGPIGLTVWGWGSAATAPFNTVAVSYAYPAGASIQPINTVTVPAVPQ